MCTGSRICASNSREPSSLGYSNTVRVLAPEHDEYLCNVLFRSGIFLFILCTTPVTMRLPWTWMTQVVTGHSCVSPPAGPGHSLRVQDVPGPLSFPNLPKLHMSSFHTWPRSLPTGWKQISLLEILINRLPIFFFFSFWVRLLSVYHVDSTLGSLLFWIGEKLYPQKELPLWSILSNNFID